MNMQVAIQVFATVFGGGGVAWLVGLWRDKRKADAEAGQHDASAAEIIQKASGEAVKFFQAQWDKDQEKLARQDAQIAQLKDNNAKLIANAREHEQWDRTAVARLAEVGVVLPAPPTLHLEGL